MMDRYPIALALEIWTKVDKGASLDSVMEERRNICSSGGNSVMLRSTHPQLMLCTAPDQQQSSWCADSCSSHPSTYGVGHTSAGLLIHSSPRSRKSGCPSGGS